MGSHHTEAADVVQFVHPAHVAVGRSRKAASVVILKRLRQVLAETELRPSDWGQIGDAIHGDLHIAFNRNEAGVCFRIDGPQGGPPLMSGYIDPRRPGQYVGGKLHVMSWRRGWERALF
jgi:hypothetical protein